MLFGFMLFMLCTSRYFEFIMKKILILLLKADNNHLAHLFPLPSDSQVCPERGCSSLTNSIKQPWLREEVKRIMASIVFHFFIYFVGAETRRARPFLKHVCLMKCKVLSGRIYTAARFSFFLRGFCKCIFLSNYNLFSPQFSRNEIYNVKFQTPLCVNNRISFISSVCLVANRNRCLLK